MVKINVISVRLLDDIERTGDYRVTHVSRSEVLCLYEPRTQRAVTTGLVPREEYRKDGESA